MATWLTPVSWVYASVITLRNRAFEAGVLNIERIGVPVVSVGNMTAGGTGKTPLVQYLASRLRLGGKKVGIVSRGYGRRSRGLVVVADGQRLLVDAGAGGDEPVQLALGNPGTIVVVAERRVEAGLKARALGADIVIADDGFQHRYLHRDLDIVVVDGTTDLTTEPMLPAGRLREPLRGMVRAGLIAVAQTGGKGAPDWLNRIEMVRHVPVVCFRRNPLPARRAADGGGGSVAGERALVFSGIGNHARFVETAREAGIRVAAGMAFSDHHEYTAGDIRTLLGEMKKVGAGLMLTTEKDVSRLLGTAIGRDFVRDIPVYCLPVEVVITHGEEHLAERLAGLR
jgi:tetraacyldisaccharide 4'-kinase